MGVNNINIWGSCVSRDAVEFASGAAVGMYCARQSIVSSVARPVSCETIRALSFKDATHPFHRRIVEEDFLKTSLDQLRERQAGEVVVLDLIEERVALGFTHCGTYVTFSQAASGFSNARSLLSRIVEPYSDEYINLFSHAVGEFSAKLAHRTVVIHKALYAEGEWEFDDANRVLDEFYAMIIGSLNSSSVIEVAECFRVSSPEHKWGLAPYHYIDAYYQEFVKHFASKTGFPVSVKPNFTLQKSI